MLSYLQQSFTYMSKAIVSYILPLDFLFLIQIVMVSETFFILLAFFWTFECNVHSRTLWTTGASKVRKKAE